MRNTRNGAALSGDYIMIRLCNGGIVLRLAKCACYLVIILTLTVSFGAGAGFPAGQSSESQANAIAAAALNGARHDLQAESVSSQPTPTFIPQHEHDPDPS